MSVRASDDPLNERILNAATELFQADGYQGATADEISESAGITKRTLYRRMGDKENILFQIHERFLNELRTTIGTIDGTSTDALKTLATVHLQTIANHQGAIRVFYEEMKHLSADNFTEIARQRKDYWEVVERLLADEVRDGTFRDVDIRIAAHGFLGALNGTYRWYRLAGELTSTQLADVATQLFLEGLAVKHDDQASGDDDLLAEVLQTSTTEDPDSSWSSSPVLSSILAAATSLFSRTGYMGTTTREIADAVGITKAALYYHIGSKEELLFQIINKMNRIGLRELKRVVEPGAPATLTLSRMFVVHTHVLAQNHDVFTVFNEDYKHLDQERRQSLAVDRDAYTRVWEDVIAEGQSSGELKKGDNRVTVLLLMGTLNTLTLWFRSDGRLTPEGVGRSLADLALHGLIARPTP